MDIEIVISQYIDGELTSEAEAELHHTLAVAPEARALFRQQIALNGIARDARVLVSPTDALHNSLFRRLKTEGMQVSAMPAANAASLSSDRRAIVSAAKLTATGARASNRRRIIAAMFPFILGIIVTGALWNVFEDTGKKNPTQNTIASNDVTVSPKLPDQPNGITSPGNEVPVVGAPLAAKEVGRHTDVFAGTGVKHPNEEAIVDNKIVDGEFDGLAMSKPVSREPVMDVSSETPADTGGPIDNTRTRRQIAPPPEGIPSSADFAMASATSDTRVKITEDQLQPPQRNRRSGPLPLVTPSSSYGRGGITTPISSGMGRITYAQAPPPSIPQQSNGTKPSAAEYAKRMNEKVVVVQDVQYQTMNAPMVDGFTESHALFTMTSQQNGNTLVVSSNAMSSVDTIRMFPRKTRTTQETMPTTKFALVVGAGGSYTMGTATSAWADQQSVKFGGEWSNGHHVYAVLGRSGYRENEAVTTTTTDAASNVLSTVVTRSLVTSHDIWGGAGYRYTLALSNSVRVGGGVSGALSSRYMRATVETPVTFQVSERMRICVAPSLQYNTAIGLTTSNATVSQTTDQATGNTVRADKATSLEKTDEVRAGASVGVEVQLP